VEVTELKSSQGDLIISHPAEDLRDREERDMSEAAPSINGICPRDADMRRCN
jgi:hypothetical protein